MNHDPRSKLNRRKPASSADNPLCDVTLLTLAQWDQDIARLRHQLHTLQCGLFYTGSAILLQDVKDTRAHLADELRMRRRFERALRELEGERC